MRVMQHPIPPVAGRYLEDLEANLQTVEALAPIHCGGCNGYHLKRARRRVSGIVPNALDRFEIERLVRDHFEYRRATTGHAFDVLIAGSADTNLLAISAEAIADAGRKLGVQIRYTVLDRCWTPLELCNAFARNHGLDVLLRQADICAPPMDLQADIVVVHSLLRFLPETAHLGAMRWARHRLKPAGAIIFSHRLAVEATKAQPFYLSEYRLIAPLTSLISEAGLRIVTMQEHLEEPATSMDDTPHHRMLALLQPADE